MKKLCFVFLCMAALAGNSFGTWYQAYGSGNWSDVTKWGSGLGYPAPVPPQPADSVNIDINQIMNLDINLGGESESSQVHR